MGLENYQRMLEDPRLHNALLVTVHYVFFSVPMQLLLALALALLLDRGLRGLALYRSVYYLPSLLGGSVAIAILWRRVFGSDGLVNSLLELRASPIWRGWSASNLPAGSPTRTTPWAR